MRRLLVTVLAVTALGVAMTIAPASAYDVSAPVVTVDDTGDSPRAELRYVLAEGTTQQSRLVLNTRVTQQLGDDERTADSPEIELVVTAAVGTATQDSMLVTFTIDDVRVGEGQGTSAIEDAIEPLIGFAATLEMTNRGEVLSSEGEVPDDLDETAGQLLDQFLQQARSLAVPFPEEPVGEGARWSARAVSTINNLEIRQTARYELTSLDDGGVELAIRITQRAPRQSFEDPASGIEVELVSSKGSGSGSATVVFDQPFPTSSETDVRVRQRLRAQGERLSQTVEVDARTEPA
jgi:hypothetical protein